jgi:hypothetical protein
LKTRKMALVGGGDSGCDEENDQLKRVP